ncbi:armadillo-type protein [Pholiota molesta]|nr:armadillo-type protein [Pholiota molesta]
MLAQLFTFKEFRETLNTEEMILKIFAKLKDHDSDVCAAAVAALQGFSNDESYYSDLELSVPTIVAQLDDENWKIRQQAIGMLKMFSKSDVFQETLKTNGVITKLIAMLSEDKDEDVRVAAVEAVSILCTNDYFEETMNTGNNVSKLSDRLLDDDSSVRLAAFQAMSILSTHGLQTKSLPIFSFLRQFDIILGTYNMDIKSKVSVINVVKQLEDELSWSTRQRAVQTLSQFATIVDFQVDMNTEKTVSKVANMLTGDNDDDVRTASAKALSVFGAQESLQKAFNNVRNAVQSTMLALSTQAFHQNDIKAAIPTLMGQLENSSWAETLKTEGFITKLVARLKDTDEDVRAAAAHALSMLGTKDTFKEKMMVEKAIPKLLAQITDNHDTARNAVHDALLALGKQENVIEFLQTVVSTLNTVDKPGW